MRLGSRWFIKRRGIRQPAAVSRRQIEAMLPLTPRPPRSTKTEAVNAGGVPADRITVPQSKPGRYVLFLHGGAYRAGSPASYRHFTWRIAAAARAHVLALDYRLAPEHPFPAALEDTVAAYRWLLGQGVDAAATLIMGDSAGATLTLAALLKLRDEGLPLPAGAVALSPMTDLALTGASLHGNARKDSMLNTEDLPRLVDEYLAGADPRHPYASPLYGEVAGLPPVLIHVGGEEIFLDDAVRMHEKLRQAGGELEVWPRMVHVWHLFVPMLPEAKWAIERIGRFARRVLGDAE